MLKINYSIAIEYIAVSGKTQALFGLIHMDRFYYGVIGLISLIIGILSLTKEDKRYLSLVSILISIASIIFTFLDVWKIFI